MASETITRNDLTSILNEVLPPTPSEYRKLLWMNPSPSSSFGEQSVSISGISDYDEIDVYAKRLSDDARNTYVSVRCGIGYNGMLVGGNSSQLLFRFANMTSTGVTFSAGYSNGTTNNDVLVPFRVYGIKYERVSPPQAEDTSGVIELGTKYGGTVKYIKTNGVVSVYLANSSLSGMTANADNNWDAQLPVGFRPLSEPFARLYNDNGYAYITTSGTVRVNPTSASGWMGFCITYVATA